MVKGRHFIQGDPVIESRNFGNGAEPAVKYSFNARIDRQSTPWTPVYPFTVFDELTVSTDPAGQNALDLSQIRYDVARYNGSNGTITKAPGGINYTFTENNTLESLGFGMNGYIWISLSDLQKVAPAGTTSLYLSNTMSIPDGIHANDPAIDEVLVHNPVTENDSILGLPLPVTPPAPGVAYKEVRAADGSRSLSSLPGESRATVGFQPVAQQVGGQWQSLPHENFTVSDFFTADYQNFDPQRASDIVVRDAEGRTYSYGTDYTVEVTTSFVANEENGNYPTVSHINNAYSGYTWTDTQNFTGDPDAISGVRIRWIADGGTFTYPGTHPLNDSMRLNVTFPTTVVGGPQVGRYVGNVRDVGIVRYNISANPALATNPGAVNYLPIPNPGGALAIDLSINGGTTGFTGDPVKLTIDPRITRGSWGDTYQYDPRITVCLPNEFINSNYDPSAGNYTRVPDFSAAQEAGYSVAAGGTCLTGNGSRSGAGYGGGTPNGTLYNFTYNNTDGMSLPSDLPQIVIEGKSSLIGNSQNRLAAWASLFGPYLGGDDGAFRNPKTTVFDRVTLNAVRYAGVDKVGVNEEQVERNQDMDYSLTWVNTDQNPDGVAYFVDILPHNGDGRGTSVNGPVDLQSLELFADPTTRTTVQLTFDDPSAINKNEPPYNTVEWKDWTSGSTTVDGTPIRDATAVRVTVTEFKVGELGQGHLNVSVAAPEAREGDVLKNTVFGVMNFKIDDEPSPLQKILEEQTNAVTKSIIASETSGQILDVYGAPYEGVRVMVYARGLNGLPVGEPLGEAVTDANGNYAIDNLVSGEYVTVVESQPTDLAALWDYDDAVAGTERPTADPTLTCNDEVATTETPDRAGFTVGVDTEQPNVDFIYGPIPCIDLEKTASLQVVGVAGTPIDYTFTATNTGTVELSDVEITDDLLPEGTEITYTWPNPDRPGFLAPDETLIANATYIVTQADANVGTITNTAEVSGVNVRNTQQSVTDQDSVTVSLPHNPSLVFDKTSSYTAGDEGSTVGDEIEYSFTIENTGNVTLTDVAITDDKVGDITYTWPEGNAPGTLNPGETTTATAVYVLTQDDVDASQVVNTASVTGTPPPGGDHEPPVETDTDITPVVQAPQIDIVKTVSEANERSVVGDKLTYTFTITNTGNVTLSDVILTDPLPNLDFGSPIPPTKDSLAPGETWTVTAELTLLQSHIDIGSVENTAFTSGEPPAVPDGTLPARVSDTDAADVTLGQQPEVELTKSVSEPSNPAVEGEVLTYTFEVVNTGNVTLTGVFISDPLQGLSAITYDWPGTQPGVLAPGETVTATATYAVILADIESGSIDNTAMAAGRTLSGVNVSDEDSASVELQENPVISLFKDDSYTPTGPDGTAQAGDIVTYTFTITNVGNVTLDPITLVDDHDVVWAEDMDVADLGPLAPEEEAIVTATYVLTQEDIDAGEIVNSATATGSSPIGTEVTSESSVPTRLNQAPGIELTKDASYDVDGPASVGEPIAYNFVITNTGNVTLTGIELADQLEGISEIAFGQWPGAENTLAPGQSVVANATYNLTQEDINAGIVTNDASVIGHPPSGDPVSDDASVDTPVDRASDISIVKTNVFDGVGRVGETIEYSIVVTNTGNQTLTNVVVTDDLEGLTWAEDSDPVIGTMQPGESVILEATYTLTQDDVNTGRVVNTASVTGDDPTDTPVNDDDSTTTEVNGEPGISLVKTNSLDGDAVAGSVITYTFEVTNTGNVTLDSVVVVDDHAGLVWVDDPQVGTLQPGDTVTLTATYAVTQDDLDAGFVYNEATVTGTPPTGDPVTSTDDTETPWPPVGAIQIVTNGELDQSRPTVPGDLAIFTFSITNIDNVTLRDVTLETDLEGLEIIDTEEPDPSQPGVLLPGESMLVTAQYPLTQADIDQRVVEVTGTAIGQTPLGDRVIDIDPAAVTPVFGDDLVFVKSADFDRSENSQPGDIITYTFTVTNDGNATVNNVEVTDPMEGLTDLTYQWPGNPGELKPGESVTATATYELTAEDIAAGQVENTATANATVGDEPIDPVDSTVIVYPVRGASLDFDKVASFDAEQAHVGDEVTYEFTVSNTGNVTLTDLVVTDPFEGLQWVDEPTINNLAPGDTVTITATYELTQADIDAGMLTNTATVTGEDPDGTPVTGEDTEITDLPQVSALEVVKSSDKETAHAGEIVTYTVTVTNTGTVTLSDVSTVDHLEGFTFSDDVDPQIGVLSPGETVSVTGTYLVTDEDVEAGSVNNVATVSATDPSGDTVHGEDRVEVPTQPTEVEPTPDPDPELTPDPEPEPDKPVPGPVGDLLAKTGVTGAAQLMVMVLVLVALGGLCLMVARRRTEDEA